MLRDPIQNSTRAIQNDTRQFTDPSRGETVRAFNNGD
jgi:hypothetical protein